ncbi:Sec-independent protein translocase subunit TatA [Nocardioides sp. JQ2195]|uniref:Sec-independent protein translocase subunit TatA n=1 Tax=Nocardioides sp. JQ2195 TaxID=2592334 RepID=UPI00143E4804|nr:Sec-independent protein translocase subunit TatA [Nocardioides sp. JQ2195]QIX26697.1 Sec-independent protein translocase subunit TatA [Nocardioides sp. JQ2195]
MFSRIGPLEITLILLLVVLLFGAKKLPELARGTGRALRIFKAETKGLIDDDDDDQTKPAPKPTGELNAPDRSTDSEALKSEQRPDSAS